MSTFLTKNELKTGRMTHVVDLLTGFDDDTVDNVISESIEVMRNYLFQYYDVETIFSATEADRHKVVLKHLKKIVIYELHCIRGNINDQSQIGYDEAMTWLEGVGTGKKPVDLPRKQEDTDGDGTPDSDTMFLNTGSKTKYKTSW